VYVLTGEKAGFRKVEKTVTVVVGQNLANNFTLEIGNVSEVIQVESAPPLLQVENANLATTFESFQVENLPNGGQDMTSVAQTAPGVLMNTSQGGGYGNFTAYGLPATANLFTINGNDANDPYLNLNNSGATNLMLGTNEVQEVAVVSNAYTGQYGRQAGAQIDYVTKSGTNQFHGNAAYWYNGGGMNANDFFNNATNTPLPHLVNNQWAWSVGGPIKKDKIFFFVDQEGLRYILGTSNLTILPTPAFGQAVVNNLPSFGMNNSAAYYSNMFNLSNNAIGISRAQPVGDSIDTTGNLGCGDLNTTGGSGTVVPGFAQFGGSSGTSNGAYGTNLGGGTPCAEYYRSTVGQLSTEWTLAAKMDVNFNDNNHASIRYRMDRGIQPTYTDPISPVFNATSNQPQYEGQINWNHIISPTKTNQLILSGLWYGAIFGPEATAAQKVYPGNLIDLDTSTWGSSGSGAWLGGENLNFPQGRNVSQIMAVDDFSWTMGNHTLKFGGNFRYNKVSDHGNQVLTNPELLILSTTDFVEGISDYIRQRHPNLLSTSVGIYSLGLYFQDEWRVNPALKLTLALRTDRNSNADCYQKCFSRLYTTFTDVNHDPTIPYSQLFKNNLSNTFPGLQAFNWQPRVGFAWTPRTKFTEGGNTVVRGGVGLFSDLYPAALVDNYMHNATALRDYSISFLGLPLSPDEPGNAYAAQNNCDNIFTGVANSANGTVAGYKAAATAAGLRCTVPNYQSVNNNVVNPTYVEWNLQVQRMITPRTVIDVNYVGNHGYNTFASNPWVNAAAGVNYVTFAGLPKVAPDSRINSVSNLTNSGITNYNGLSASLTERATKGLSFRFNYTYSHTSDFVSNGGTGERYSLVDSLRQLANGACLSCNYSDSDYDVRHNITANYVWELPFKFANGFLNTVAGGWQISGTFFYRTGLPFSSFDGSAPSLLKNGTLGTVLVDPLAVVPRSCSSPSIPCFSASQFTPVGGETGFAVTPRNFYRGPGYFNSDFSVLKNFHLKERLVFALGANFFNVFNHANFANPVSDVSSGQFGSIIATVVPPTSPYGAFVGSAVSGREIQLTGRFTF
jgi:hypothetical protein